MDAITLHKKFRGKIEIRPKMKVNKNNLRLVYTPGVAEVAKEIAKNPKNSFIFTSRVNNVAIITDGSRTLGVGNNIPEASQPVMEGKAVLLKTLANVNGYPLCLATKDAKEIVRTIEILSPSFSAFNIEDIESPKCFRIMEELEKKGILTFHDDRDGVAIAVLAGLINAARVTKKDLKKLKICLAGAGTAGYGTFRILKKAGIKNLLVLDVKGIIYRWRKKDNQYLKEIAKFSNPQNIKGGLKEAIKDADVFIGLSGGGGLLKSKDISLMAKMPIIFALSNPIPEIFPEEIKKATKNYIYATGRSDFPNQVNNALVFPGIFQGMLTKRKKITLKLEIKIAKAISRLVPRPRKNKILPSIFDKRVTPTIKNCF